MGYPEDLALGIEDEMPAMAWSDQKIYRASQDCICSECKKRYGDHPFEENILSWQGEPFLNRLCNGDLVKL